MRPIHLSRVFQLLMISVIVLLPVLCRADAYAGVQPVNRVTGDRSFMERFGCAPDAGTDEDLRISTHLAYVERLLRARDVSGLPAALRRARMMNLDRLHEYLVQGVFPRNYDYPDRHPCFIDCDGRICAVGYLVEQSAGRAAAEQINRRSKYERIAEIRSPVLEQWLKTSGLALEEAAMIQPEYGYMIPGRSYYGRGAYEPTDFTLLGLRGKVGRIVTREPLVYSDVRFDRMGFIDQTMTITTSADGQKDTVYTQTDFQGDFAVRTNTYTWHPGQNYTARATTEYYPVQLDSAGNRRYYSQRKFSLYTGVLYNRDRTDSVCTFIYDPFGRLITTSEMRANVRDSSIWRISYDTLARASFPVAWMTSPLTQARKDGTMQLRAATVNASDTGSVRVLQRSVFNRIAGEEWSVLDGWGRPVLYRPLLILHGGPARIVVYEYDEMGNVAHELTMGFSSEEDMLQGFGKPIRDVVSRYTFDDKNNWVRREQTITTYENATPASTVEVAERTIEYRP